MPCLTPARKRGVLALLAGFAASGRATYPATGLVPSR
jgi:hypothetical protein